MAIYLTDKDGSDQHFDTYAEFEQAMVLMSRIGGNKVPQDLLDEVSAKYGVKEPEPFQVQINGTNFESAFREATRELAEELDEISKDRTPVSDESENVEEDTKIEVGDKVRVVSADDGTSDPFHGFRVGSTVEVKEVYGNGRLLAFNGTFCQTLLPHHCEKEDDVKDSTEFRTGDIVMVTESFKDSMGDRTTRGDVYEFDENLGFGDPFVGIVYLGDNHDKLRLVCRKEDRKDIEL